MAHLQTLGDSIEKYAESEEQEISGSIYSLERQAVYQCLKLSTRLLNGIIFGYKEQNVIHICYVKHTVPILNPGVRLGDLEVIILDFSLEMVIPGQWSLDESV